LRLKSDADSNETAQLPSSSTYLAPIRAAVRTRRPIVLLRLPILLTVLTGLSPLAALAARPSEELLPNTTKAYISIPDLEKLSAAWNKTQLGQLVNDPEMKPFVEDLQRQLKAKFSQAGVRLSVTFDDLAVTKLVAEPSYWRMSRGVTTKPRNCSSRLAKTWSKKERCKDKPQSGESHFPLSSCL
jgi:hypothetical protein